MVLLVVIVLIDTNRVNPDGEVVLQRWSMRFAKMPKCIDSVPWHLNLVLGIASNDALGCRRGVCGFSRQVCASLAWGLCPTIGQGSERRLWLGVDVDDADGPCDRGIILVQMEVEHSRFRFAAVRL